MVGTLAHFARKPRLLERVRALGFDWDDTGLLLTVPLPATFRRRMGSMGLATSGVSPELVEIDALDIPVGSWLSHLAGGKAPIQVGTELLYGRNPRGSRGRGDRSEERLIHHLLAFVHDMTKHVLPLHLVPREHLVDMGARAIASLGSVRRFLARELWLAPALGSVPKGWLVPAPLLTFYENDLVDYCHAVWKAIERPEDFAPTFTRAAHYQQLSDVLTRRLEQAGRLGVSWGEMPPRPYARFEIDV